MSDEKKGQLHQILAKIADAEKKARLTLTEAIGTFKRSERFLGKVRTLKMFDADRQKEEGLPEQSVVATTVGEKLDYLVETAIVPWIDMVVTKEATCQVAKADLKIGNKTFTGVPGTALLALESRFTEIRATLLEIPTLSPGISWSKSDDREGLYTAPPTSTNKTEKKLVPIVLYPHSDKHPAQVKEATEDKVVGSYTDIVSSGMMPVREKANILQRIDEVIAAIKDARQRANCAEIIDVKIGKDIMNFIIAG